MTLVFFDGEKTAEYEVKLHPMSHLHCDMEEWTIKEDDIPDFLRNIIFLNFEREHDIDCCDNMKIEWCIVYDAENNDYYLAVRFGAKETMMNVELNESEIAVLREFEPFKNN